MRRCSTRRTSHFKSPLPDFILFDEGMPLAGSLVYRLKVVDMGAGASPNVVEKKDFVF